MWLQDINGDWHNENHIAKIVIDGDKLYAESPYPNKSQIELTGGCAENALPLKTTIIKLNKEI
jgi:hypothetical protein